MSSLFRPKANSTEKNSNLSLWFLDSSQTAQQSDDRKEVSRIVGTTMKLLPIRITFHNSLTTAGEQKINILRSSSGALCCVCLFLSLFYVFLIIFRSCSFSGIKFNVIVELYADDVQTEF